MNTTVVYYLYCQTCIQYIKLVWFYSNKTTALLNDNHLEQCEWEKSTISRCTVVRWDMCLTVMKMCVIKLKTFPKVKHINILLSLTFCGKFDLDMFL